ncbi:MAG: RdgB/HAM1 family non-canonical purine NTP pyrophosphatase [Ruminococcaceae bacterium]|nr:RdgB/HAM1 family non-canonical purine NTP pyrophosphatase [Oscillospiraceae bacterium]
MVKFVFASRNEHKAREVAHILSRHLEFDFQVLTLDDIGYEGEIVEDGKTFEENAMIKAKAAFSKSGLPSFADDSGLEVDSLHGEPGIYSARYASLDGRDADDEDNNNLLLKNLEDKEDRTARFVSAVAFIDSDTSFVTRGEVEGEILHERQGSGGFGYDPLFFCREADCCFGILPPEEKNKISHRARAFESLAKILNKRYKK